MSAHFWTSQPVPAVTVPNNGQPASCTCQTFTDTGTCRHAREAYALQDQLDRIWCDRRLEQGKPVTAEEIKDEIIDVIEATPEAKIIRWLQVIIAVHRGWMEFPYDN